MQYLPKELRVYMDYQKINLRLNEHCSVFFNYEWALIIYLMKIRVRIRDQECNHFMNERFRCSHMDKNNCCACFSLS